jgi:two-component system NtrC family sensor kinase
MITASQFDREASLAELLPPAVLTRLGPALATLLGDAAALRDAAGHVLWGAPVDGMPVRAPLILELEPLGHLEASSGHAVAAAAALLTEILKGQARYRMASSLHLEAVAADFEKLKAEHAALQQSEARLRALSAELERRVEEQVAVLEERQRQLYQAEKLAAVGQLAAGIAHEINNPIGFIRSNVNTFGGYLGKVAALKSRLDTAVWKDLDLDFVLADGRELVADSIAGIDRIARIVKDLRGFSNIDRPEEEVIDVNDSLRAAASVIEGQKPAGVAVRLDLRPLPPLLCLPGHLNQVFLNVLINALQAVGDRGEIRVASRAEGTRIVVAIGDDGPGIAPEILDRVFDPFFTTRAVGQGTGLGLTVARDIVRAHDGSISLESTPGRGTTVTIGLPT